MDRVSPETRSQIMSRIRSRGNRSTEKRLRAALVSNSVSGWCMHPNNIPGTPDFFFPERGVAIFVDGCFWHGCPKCYRRPKSRQDYWDNKLKRNIRRDRNVDNTLREIDVTVLRIWEHEISDDLRQVMCRIGSILREKSYE